MPLIYQKHITRDDLRANPDRLYVFGDNVQRKGLRGQAAAMRGEPNARGIATKWRPSLDQTAFFTDDLFNEICRILTNDLIPVAKHLHAGGTVVWPEDGIGTGLSQLPIRAPRVWRILEETRLALESIKHAQEA